MKFKSQEKVLEELKLLAAYDRHSILIEGPRGCGKSYCSKQYAQYNNISTIHFIEPKVAEIKQALEDSMQLDEKHLICIENLDYGSNQASQSILKYLEEPTKNVYIVVTCVNKHNVSSTIPSRSCCLKLSNPTQDDLDLYGRSINAQKFEVLVTYPVYKSCKSFVTLEYLLNSSLDKIDYYSNFADESFWNLTVDQITWNLSHYQDGSKCKLPLVLLTIFYHCHNSYIQTQCVKALQALESGRLSETAVLGKFVIDIKCN